MKLAYALVMAVTLFIGSIVDAHAVPQIYEVSSKKTISYKQFIDGIKGSGVVFLGDTHDDPKQHQNQLNIIQSLQVMNGDVAIALEMFTAENQQQLDDWTKGKLDEQEFKKIYAKNWSYDWQLYRDIFIYARDNHIPMIALNVPKPMMSKVVRQGRNALSDNDRKLLPPHMSWTLNEAQMEFLLAIRAQNFGNRPSPIPLSNFADAQTLRNNMMAWQIARFKERLPNSTVIAIAGTWHAIRSGAPEQLKAFSKATSKVVLPQLPEFVIENATTDEADFFILR